MQTMNISLPERLKEFVERQVASGRYSSVSEYVRELVRRDERRQAQKRLETLLAEGAETGTSTEMTRQDWQEIRNEALRQFEVRRKRKSA